MNEHMESAGIRGWFCVLVLLTFGEMEAGGLAGSSPPVPILLLLLAPTACTDQGVGDIFVPQA